MSTLDFITNILNLPQDCLELLAPHVFQLTLPVQPQRCLHCQKQTSLIHAYRRQPIKTLGLVDTSILVYYRKRRYWCPHCHKAFAEENPFISRYQRMTRDMIACIIKEHGSLLSSADIARRYDISNPTALVQTRFTRLYALRRSHFYG